MKKESLDERYSPNDTEMIIWWEMKRVGLSLDDLDPSKNDRPAEGDINKARKKEEIEIVMSTSGITFENMKEFASYLHENPLLAAAGDDDRYPSKMDKDLYKRFEPFGLEWDLWSEMRQKGLKLDDLDESKNAPDEKNPSKLHIQWMLRSSGVTFEALKELASHLSQDDDDVDDRDIFPLGVYKPQMDDGVLNKLPAPLASTGAVDKEQMDDGFPNKRHRHDLAPTGAASDDDDDDDDDGKERMDEGVLNKPHGLPQKG